MPTPNSSSCQCVWTDVRLVHLAVQGFRNLAPASLDIDARFVVIHGPNGQGKTNLLEAVWYLATLRPLRGHRVRDLIGWEADVASVGGRVLGGEDHRFRVDLGKEGRKLKIDGEPSSDLPSYFSGIRVVGFAPQHGRIVSDEPKLRREWLDRAAFTADPEHLQRVRRYSHLLKQKAAALRADAELDWLEAMDLPLARAGAELVLHRERVLQELIPHIDAVHRDICGGEGELELRYRSIAQGGALAEKVDRLLEAYRARRDEERRRRTSLVGPQRDDVAILLDGRPARTFASRGQIRSIVLALKLSELMAARARGDAPIFLLDDLSSELDRERTGRLVRALLDLGAQVFVTTTDPHHLTGLPEGQTLSIEVREGQLSVQA